MKKTIIFYYHNFWWLGHWNRISLIIQNIITHFWGEYNIVVLNSWEKQDFLFIHNKNLKIINLPNYQINYYNIHENDFNKKIKIFRKTIFKKLLSITKIELLVVEHYPFWRNFLNDEIKYLVNEFKKFNDRGNVFSSVRDIFDINSIQKENLELFDRFLIHGYEKIINYEKYFSKEINRKIIYTWYVVNEIEELKAEEKNHILVSIWWWQDWVNWIIDFVQKLNNTNFIWKLYINLWKNYNDENIEKINNISKFELEIKDYFDNFLELKNQAKLVVSMWWYNNLTENLFYKKKTIIYPRISDKEQQTRLELFTKKVDFVFDWNKLDSKSLDIILSSDFAFDTTFDFNWAYFSAAFLVNFKKYKFIKIRLTNACNANCDMCWVIKRKREYNDIINIKKSILDYYKLGWEVLNFTWWEPTIYKWFFELLEFTKSLWLITSVSTNWSLLWDKFYEKIVINWKSRINFIDISVDWLYWLHDKIREYKWLFDIIDKNLEKLKQLWIYIHINITVRKDNILEMKNIFDFFKGKGVDSMSFWMITISPINDTSNLIASKENLKKFYIDDKKYILENKWNINISFSPDFLWWIFDEFVDYIYNKNSFEKKEWLYCNFIKSKKEIRINENWNISPCCELDNYDEWIWNINNESLLKIVCSQNYEKFLNKKFPNISNACLNCKIEI